MAELLAPCGSIQSFYAAIYSGADAVYLGLDQFNARIKADNFNLDNIVYYINLAHLFGVKVYITFNTNIKPNEMADMEKYIQVASLAKADAFIVTDLGMLDIYRKYNVPLHASTQMGIHNLAGAKFLEDMGFSRVVLSREALESDILQIKQNTNLEIEYFVHGALCVSFSGGCLMSSFMNGDSGNRGRCNQPCRLAYTTTLNNNPPKYLLSTSDQCFLHKLDRLLSLGVDSLKIEGRLKQPHYVGEVVSIYRSILDKKSSIDNAKMSRLYRAYNRGNFSGGYNYNNTKEIMSIDIQGNIGDYVGEVVSCKAKTLTIKSNKALNVGDGIKIIVGKNELAGMSVTAVNYKNGLIVIPCNQNVPVGAKVYITLDSVQVEKYKNVRPRLRVDFSLVAKVDKNVILTARSCNQKASVEGDILEMSTKYSLNGSQFEKSLSRLGESNFELGGIELDIDESAFLPTSMLNNLRRQVLEQLESNILSDYAKNMQTADYSKYLPVDYQSKYVDKSRVFVQVNNTYVIDKYIQDNANIVIDIESFDDKNIDIVLNYLINENKNEDIINHTYIKLPKIARGKDFELVENFVQKSSKWVNGIVCDNIYAISLAKKYNLAAIGGIGLNIYNNQALTNLQLDYAIASVELNTKELKELDKSKICVFSYGYIPVMTLSHCPVQLNTNCTCSTCKYAGDFYYKDKKCSYLVKRTKINHCYFNLYNPNIVDIRGKFDKIPYQNYINMVQLDKQTAKQVLADYLSKSGTKQENSTCGHLFRGVN